MKKTSFMTTLTAAAAVMLLGACGNVNDTVSDVITTPPVTTAVTVTEAVPDVTTEKLTTTEITTTAKEETATEVTTEAVTTAIPATETTTAKETTAKKETTTSLKTTTEAKTTTTAKKVYSYDGTNRLAGVKIGIDPGHQRYGNSEKEAVAPGSSTTKAKVSGGTSGTSTGIPEYVTNLEISLMLKAKLEAEGATVYMTRESHDVNISNQERTKMMNDNGVDLMLRIHCDGASNTSARGIGLFVSRSNGIAAQSYEYAKIMLPIIVQYTGANNRGVTQNDDYTGQNWAEVPCMMIECGFLSNAQDDKLLNSIEYQEKLTDGILEGIVACFAG